MYLIQPSIKGLHLRLEELYKGACCSVSLRMEYNQEGLDIVFEKALKFLYEKGGYSLNDLYVSEPYKALIESFDSILSSPIDEYSFSEKTSSLLKNNAFVFSTIRSHAQLVELGLSLIDDGGKIKSWTNFLKDAKVIGKRYNETYLQAEYEFATASIQSAAQWEEYLETADDYYLQYRTAGDDRVRAEHAAMDGITLPQNDPFWKEYYPPNGWRCRCTVVQVLKGFNQATDSQKAIKAGEKATSQIDSNDKNRLALFRFNPGELGAIMPPDHPFWKVPGSTKISFSEVAFRLAYTSKEGHQVFRHKDVELNSSDFNRLYKAAQAMTREFGEDIYLMPRFNSPTKNIIYDDTFQFLKGTSFYGKCPDFRIGKNMYAEHEGFKTLNAKRAFNNMMNRGLEQSDILILDDCGLSDRYMKRSIQDRILRGAQVSSVYVIKGKLIRKIL